MTILNEHGKLTGFTLFYNETKRNWQMSTSVDNQSWDVKHISDKEAKHLLAEIDAKLERPAPDVLSGRLNFKPKSLAVQPVTSVLRNGDLISDSTGRLSGHRARLPDTSPPSRTRVRL